MLNRRQFALGSASALAMLCAPAEAGIHHSVLANFPAPSGKILVGTGNYPGGCFLDQFARSDALSSTVNSDLGLFNADGYPVDGATFSGTVTTQTHIAPWVLTTDTLFISWSGTLAITLSIGTIANLSDPGSVVKLNNGNLTLSGTNGRITFTLPAIPGAFPAYWHNSGFLAGTFLGASNLRMGRVSDETAIHAITRPEQMFYPGFVSVFQQYNPRTFRPMSAAPVNQSNVSRFAYRTNWKTGFGIFSSPTIPSIWSGNITQGAGDAFTATAPPGWAGQIDGATIQGYTTGSNTGYSPTLTVNGVTARIVQSNLYNNGTAQTANCAPGVISAAPGGNVGILTLVYNAALDLWVFTSGGLIGCVPIELRVAMANLINSDFYDNISHLFDNASIVAEAQYVSQNLANQLARGVFEYSNEMWNPGFTQFQYALGMGVNYGFNYAGLSFHGYKSQQVMAQVTTGWGSRPGLVRLSAIQGGGDHTQNTMQWQGQEVGAGFNPRCQIASITRGATLTTIGTSTPHGFSTGDHVFNSGSCYSSINPNIIGLLNVSDTFNVSASTTAVNQALNQAHGFTKQITNNASSVAHYLLGGSGTTATADQRCVAIQPGQTIQISDDVNFFISIILESGTGTVTVLQGTDLDTSITQSPVTVTVVDAVTFTFPRNTATWQAYVSGGTVYKAPASINYPVNVNNDGCAYATYFSGAKYGNFAIYNSPATLAASSMITDCLNWANGTPTQQATALANMNDDINNATTTGFQQAGSSLFILKQNYYNNWNPIISGYGKLAFNYEGFAQLSSPTSAQLAAAAGLFTGAGSVTIGGVLTVTRVDTGAVTVGMIFDGQSASLPAGTTVTGFISGTPGGVGMYSISPGSQHVGQNLFALTDGVTFPTQTQFSNFFLAWLNGPLAYATTRQAINDALNLGTDTPGAFVLTQSSSSGPPTGPEVATNQWNQIYGGIFGVPYQIYVAAADANNGR